MLVGAHGYGRGYLDRIARLHAAGRLRLVGVADPRPLDDEQRALAGDALFGPDAAALIAATRPELVVIATPVHTHVDLAVAALRSGAHVLLEKPPAPTLDGLDRLLAAQRASGRACQVGFQAFGSGAAVELARLIRDGELGALRGIGVTGLWWRDHDYWDRATWAGRRWLDGRPVNDGALTNPFAHGIALGLRLDGSRGDEPVRKVELDLYRTRATEAHDTAAARIRTARGTILTVAVTLCARPPVEPVLTVTGSLGSAVLHYTEDRLAVDRPPTVRPPSLREPTFGSAAEPASHEPPPPVRVGPSEAPGYDNFGRQSTPGNSRSLDSQLPGGRADGMAEADAGTVYGRADLLENLLDHLADPGVPLLVPLADTLSFTQVAEAVRQSPAPLPVAQEELTDLPELTRRAAATGRLYRELGADWARAEPYVWTPEGRA